MASYWVCTSYLFVVCFLCNLLLFNLVLFVLKLRSEWLVNGEPGGSLPWERGDRVWAETSSKRPNTEVLPNQTTGTFAAVHGNRMRARKYGSLLLHFCDIDPYASLAHLIHTSQGTWSGKGSGQTRRINSVCILCRTSWSQVDFSRKENRGQQNVFTRWTYQTLSLTMACNLWSKESGARDILYSSKTFNLLFYFIYIYIYIFLTILNNLWHESWIDNGVNAISSSWHAYTYSGAAGVLTLELNIIQ